MGWVDLVVLLAVLALVALPFAARLAADSYTGAPPRTAILAPLRPSPRTPAPQVRALPVFLSLSEARVAALAARGTRAEIGAIVALGTEVFGRRGARQLQRTLATPTTNGVVPLPTIVPGQTAAENDLAALLMVAGSSQPIASARPPAALVTAGEVASDLLGRLAPAGGCAARLNLAFLASLTGSAVAAVQRDYGAAEAACPGDPTPWWALGEYESQWTAAGQAPAVPKRQSDPVFQTFARMQQLYPRVAASWAGEGDADMRIAYQLVQRAPFTAIAYATVARACYGRAVRLEPDFADLAGLARALAALRDPWRAARTAGRAASEDPDSADLQAWLLDDLQQAGEFRPASTVAAHLALVHVFASGAALFAAPSTGDAVNGEDTAGPLSTGVATLAPRQLLEPLAVPTAPSGESAPGGAIVNDLSFLPAYTPIPGFGGKARWCPALSRRIDLILAGEPGAALAPVAGAAGDLRPGFEDCPPPGVAARLTGVAELELGRTAAARRALPQGMSLGELEDYRQNLWRAAGRLSHAAIAAAQWAALQPASELALSREGEIAFLQRRYDEAATDFAVLVNRARLQTGHPSGVEANALLDEGVALASAGRAGPALATLGAAAATAERWGGEYVRTNAAPADLAAFSMEQAATASLSADDVRQALMDYAVAADARGAALRTESAYGSPTLPAGTQLVRADALDNNEAIAEIAGGDAQQGAALAQDAIRVDPGDPIFWWTLGLAEQHLGRRAAAIVDDRAALARDPTEFPVANNLGVLLLRAGRPQAAVAALRMTVRADPSYATGWFNLGIALDRTGPLHILASEGAFARARSLNARFDSRSPVPLLDDVSYKTQLDLSEPVPAHWSFASSQSHAPVDAAGFSASLIVAFGLIRLLASRAASGSAQKWLDQLDALDERVPRVRLFLSPLVGIAATVAFLLWPLHHGPSGGWEAAAFALGVLVLVVFVMRVRRVAALRTGVALEQETWLPGLAIGLVLTLVSTGWAPMPVARSKASAVGVHWSGPIALGLLSVVLLLLAAWLNVPITRDLGAAGLVITASMLTPVKPLDGATVGSSAAGALPVAAVVGAAVLMVTGVL